MFAFCLLYMYLSRCLVLCCVYSCMCMCVCVCVASSSVAPFSSASASLWSSVPSSALSICLRISLVIVYLSVCCRLPLCFICVCLCLVVWLCALSCLCACLVLSCVCYCICCCRVALALARSLCLVMIRSLPMSLYLSRSLCLLPSLFLTRSRIGCVCFMCSALPGCLCAPPPFRWMLAGLSPCQSPCPLASHVAILCVHVSSWCCCHRPRPRLFRCIGQGMVKSVFPCPAIPLVRVSLHGLGLSWLLCLVPSVHCLCGLQWFMCCCLCFISLFVLMFY